MALVDEYFNFIKEYINKATHLIKEEFFMRKRIIALFAVLLVSTVASAEIITISATNDKNSTYNERATKDTSIVSQAESSNINDFNYTQALSKVSNSNEAKRIIIKEIPVEKLTPETKQDYYHKMLNAVYKVS